MGGASGYGMLCSKTPLAVVTASYGTYLAPIRQPSDVVLLIVPRWG